MIRKKIYYAATLVLLLLLIGTIFYNIVEGWDIIDSFYFSTITLTTIGYGDISPITAGGKIFTSLYALFGIGIMLYILSSVIGVFIFKQERYFDKIFFPMKKIKKQEKKLKKQVKEIKKQEKKLEHEERKIEKHEKDIESEVKKLEKQEKKIEKIKKKIIKE